MRKLNHLVDETQYFNKNVFVLLAFMMASNAVCDEFLLEVGSPVCNLPRQEQINLLCEDVLEVLIDLENRIIRQSKKAS